jgi:hypothetical protein
MDGSVDKNTELKLSLLYFVDEAIGYRHSLHFLRRWLETEEQSELEGLIIEVGRENFVDLSPFIATVNDPSNTAGTRALHDFIKRFGIFSPEEEGLDIVKIDPLPDLDNTILENLEGNNWAMHNWVESNTHDDRSPFYSIASAFQLLNQSNGDFLAIFKLFEQMFGKDTTLFSAILNDDILSLSNILSQYYPTEKKYIDKLAQVIIENPDLNWKDALSRNQIKSKMWLIDKIQETNIIPKFVKQNLFAKPTNNAFNVLLVGGWVGVLPFLAGMRNQVLGTVVNVDIDESVHAASVDLNSVVEKMLFRTSAKDIRKLDIENYNNPLIIDTIVEHFENHGDWIKTLPAGTTVILQGNDMFDVPEHVNCHKTLEEFLESCGLNSIIWAGELNLHNCTRYMAIGKV